MTYLVTKSNTISEFGSVVLNVKETSEKVDCSGAAVVIIQDNKVRVEEYWGHQSKELNARPIQADTQFHVASVRKSYIGFAVAYAVHTGCIYSIDDLISKYLPHLDAPLLGETTLRHCLTHTHGLKRMDGTVVREFQPGTNWAYRNVGIELLCQLVRKTTGKTIAEILHEQVFLPFGFKETGWYGNSYEKLVDVIREPSDPHWYRSENTDGSEMNMYVSARELANWGSLHLNKAKFKGEQVISEDIINMVTSIQTPQSVEAIKPQNGFLWYVKEGPSSQSEMGDLVPKGSYQILGYTGVTLLIIPKHHLVAVRAFNSFGSPQGFDYLADVRSFGDTIMRCL